MKLEEVQRISGKLKISCLQLPLLALYITILNEAGAFPLLPVSTFVNAITWCLQAYVTCFNGCIFYRQFSTI